jgi:uncharacterized protein (TIGR03067 family)
MNGRTLIVVAALSFVAADAADDASKKDLEKLQGTWQLQSATRDGVAAPAEEGPKIKLTFKGNKLTLLEGERPYNATVMLDATRKPATINFVLEDGKQTVKGIYLLDGDTLKMCTGAPGNERPREFASKAGTDVSLTVYKREKK